MGDTEGHKVISESSGGMASTINQITPMTSTIPSQDANAHLANLPVQKRSQSTGSLVKAKDFEEQIRQLEMERQTLLSDASVTGVRRPQVQSRSPDRIESRYTDQSSRSEISFFTRPLGQRGRASSLSSLVDITNEQRTITELRKNLESQFHETERLQQELLSLPAVTAAVIDDTVSPQSAVSGTEGACDDEENRELYSIIGRPNMFRIERSPVADKNQLEEMRSRLRETLDLCERQKKNFHSTVEDLNHKLTDVKANRDTILDMKQREAAGQDTLISKLQQTVQHLQDGNRGLEQQIKELTTTIQTNQHTFYMFESAVKRIKAVLCDFERQRDRPLFENEAVLDQSPTMLVHCLERCLQDATAECQTAKNRLQKVEWEMTELQKQHDTQRLALIGDHREKVAHVAEEHEKQLQAAAERSVNARKQASCLQEQMDLMQEHHNQQMRLKNDAVVETEAKLKMTTESYTMNKALWATKKESLESALNTAHDELSAMKSDREMNGQETAVLRANCNELELRVARLDRELDCERRDLGKVTNREATLSTRLDDAETKLEQKNLEICKLEGQLSALRHENELNLKATVAAIAREEQERSSEKCQQVQLDLAVMTERYQNTTADLDLARHELTSIRASVAEFRDKLEILQNQLLATAGEKDNCSSLLKERVVECARLAKERDDYAELLSKQKCKLDDDDEEQRKLLNSLDEKCEELVCVRKQLENINQAYEISNRSFENLKSEHSSMNQQFSDAKLQMEEAKQSRETTSRKLKLREKRLREVDTERLGLLEEIQRRNLELEEVKAEKENLFTELKESRYEVAYLTEERDSVKKVLEGGQGDKDKQINALLNKLRVVELELNTARASLRKHTTSDDKVLKAAGKMQREVTIKRGEVDTLKSKLYWLDECLQTVQKEKNMLEEELGGLRLRLQQLSDQNQKLSADCDAVETKYRQLRDKQLILETCSEKSSIKHATMQAKLERSEQELARLKLKHQLDLKEAQRNASPQARLYGRPCVVPPVSYPALTAATGGQMCPPTVASGHDLPPLTCVYFPSSGATLNQSEKQLDAAVQDSLDVKQELKTLLSDMGALIKNSQLLVQQADSEPNSNNYNNNVHNLSANASLGQDVFVNDDVMTYVDGGDVDGAVSEFREDLSPTCRMDDILYGRQTPSLLSRDDVGGGEATKDVDVDVAARDVAPDRLRLRTTLRSMRDQSPVARLLISPVVQPTASSRSSDITESRVGRPPSRPNSRSRADDVKASLESDSSLLVRRLETKIENLLKMGDNLQKENKEVADMMKEQDRRMKKLQNASHPDDSTSKSAKSHAKKQMTTPAAKQRKQPKL